MAIASYGAEKSYLARVISVLDGDTVVVKHDNKNEKLRFNGIDCPEKTQDFGPNASNFSKEHCLDKEVTITPHGEDRYGRTIADITLANGECLNEELVKAGLAWWYRKYAPNSVVLQDLEEQARSQKIGLWQDEKPIAPWDFRHHSNNQAVFQPTKEPAEVKQ